MIRCSPLPMKSMCRLLCQPKILLFWIAAFVTVYLSSPVFSHNRLKRNAEAGENISQVFNNQLSGNDYELLFENSSFSDFEKAKMKNRARHPLLKPGDKQKSEVFSKKSHGRRYPATIYLIDCSLRL